MTSNEIYGMESPGGFAFGVQGWHWGEPKPKGITFFLDGTAKVVEQHGRPIRGALIDNKEVLFATAPPTQNDAPGIRKHFATHLQIIMALEAERIDWQQLTIAGWPQVPYAMLKELKKLPETPIDELKKIPDKKLREDALRMRREMEEAIMRAIESEG